MKVIHLDLPNVYIGIDFVEIEQISFALSLPNRCAHNTKEENGHKMQNKILKRCYGPRPQNVCPLFKLEIEIEMESGCKMCKK